MRYSTIILGCLLVMLNLEDGLSKSLVNSETTCCYEFQLRKCAYSHIKSYELTSSSCSYKAVIFTLKKGQKICVHLEEKWAQNYLNKLKKSSIKTHI